MTKKQKKRKNGLEFRFASTYKLLNRREGKNLKQKKEKKSKKCEKMRKIAKKVKKSEKIGLKFASLCFASKRKLRFNTFISF
jgi:hypothetical protein